MFLQNRNKPIDIENTDGYQMASWGGEMNSELGINIYIDTTMYKIDNQQGILQNHRQLC